MHMGWDSDRTSSFLFTPLYEAPFYYLFNIFLYQNLIFWYQTIFLDTCALESRSTIHLIYLFLYQKIVFHIKSHFLIWKYQFFYIKRLIPFLDIKINQLSWYLEIDFWYQEIQNRKPASYCPPVHLYAAINMAEISSVVILKYVITSHYI